MTDTQEVARAIEVRLAEVRREIASLEAASAAIKARGSDTTPAPTRTVGRRRKPSRATKIPASEALETLLEGSDGMSSAALGEQARAPRLQVLALLRELEAAGRVRRSGQRRGTRWHLITDEERIAARAAQLAKQSRRRAS